MKHLRWGIFFAALLVMLSTVGVYAAGGRTCGRSYTDGNNDGICDNRDTCSRAFVDADGDGFCDNRGTFCGRGTCSGTFVDTDGNGICDNQGTFCGGCGRGRTGR